MVDDAFHESGIFLFTLHVLITVIRIDTEEPRRFQSEYLSQSGPGAELLGRPLRAASTSCFVKGSSSMSTSADRGQTGNGGGVSLVSVAGCAFFPLKYS